MKASMERAFRFFSALHYVIYVIFGLFWALLAVASAGYLWLVLRVAKEDFALSVAKEDFAFFLPAMFLPILLSVIGFWVPLLLGTTMGLLAAGYLYGGDIVKQSIYHGIKAKRVFLLVPIFFISSFLLDIPIGALIDILGVPGEIFISLPGGLVVGDNLTYTGDYLHFSLIISQAIVAFAIVVVCGYIVKKTNAVIF